MPVSPSSLVSSVAGGISTLAESLKLVFSNNPGSVSQANTARTYAVAQNGDIYRLIFLTAFDASDVARVRERMKANQLTSEKAFARYRVIPV